MLGWAFFFMNLAVIAALYGFGGLAGVLSSVAQLAFFVFLLLFVVALVFGRRLMARL